MNKPFRVLAIGLLISFAVGISTNAPKAEAAFGVSPPWVKSEIVLPGTTYTQVVNVSRSDLSTDAQVALRIDGDELAEWLTIENADNLFMQRGQSILPMKVSVSVPEGAELKRHVGGIFITLVPQTNTVQGGGEVSIGLGAYVAVEITVIGQRITDYEVRSAMAEPMVKNDPFTVSMELVNRGNTPIDSLNGSIDIYDSNQAAVVEALDFLPLEEPLAFGESRTVRMNYGNLGLEPGAYWVELKALKAGNIAYESRFLQEVASDVVPVITPDDAMSGSGMTDLMGEVIVPEDAVTPMMSASQEIKKEYLIMFGLAGLAMGLIALAGIILVARLEKKHKVRKPATKKKTTKRR